MSILIPAFNGQNWIADTIKSATTQVWQRKETLAVARQFASRELKVVAQLNQGAAAACNHAFSLCQGEYVQWLDADDLLAPDKISRQMSVVEGIQDRRLLLSCAWGRFIYRVRRAKFTSTDPWALRATPLQALHSRETKMIHDPNC